MTAFITFTSYLHMYGGLKDNNDIIDRYNDAIRQIWKYTYRFRRIFDDESCELMTHVDTVHMSTGNAALEDAVLLYRLTETN